MSMQDKRSDRIANNLTPFIPVHPGTVLRDELRARGISQRRFASLMGLPPSQLNEIINGKRPLSAEHALMIEALLDISAVPLLRMQTDYNLQVARSDKPIMEKVRKLTVIAASL